MFRKDKSHSTDNAEPPFSLSTVHSRSSASATTGDIAVHQRSYQRGAQSAVTVEKQIEADMIEVRSIIANYAVEPLELLHLVDRWIQQLLDEFILQRDHFKHQLSEKWLNQELTDIKYEKNDRIRQIYTAYKELEKARDTILSQQSMDELNNYLGRININLIDEMKEKFNSLIAEYFKILQCLKSIDKEIEINDIEKNLLKLKELNNKQSHTICIVGLEKAGKSTFINALLGYELLPTASERCTQIRTVLKPPVANGDQHLFATVKFYTDQEFYTFYDKMMKKTDDTDRQFSQRKEAVLQGREKLKSKFPEEHFHINTSNDVERQCKTIIKKLNEYITGELYVNIIKEVAIYTDKLPGKNYELLDVPGFDSPIKEHRDAGLEAVKSADAFLFLTNGQQPSLTEPQVSLLQEIQQNHFQAMQRAFAIITKLDLCQTATIYQEHYEKTFAELVEKHFQPERIYVACPRIQVVDRNSEEFRVIDRKLHHFGDDIVQGFQRSKDGINKFIEYDLPKTHLKQLIDLGRMKLARYVNERIDKIKENQLLPSNLATISIDEYIQQQNTENWEKIYYENIFQPAFSRANYWHTMIVTKERANFINDVKQKFHDLFFDHTNEFMQQTFQIEKTAFEKYGPSKLQLNMHPIDTEIREKLCFHLDRILEKTSEILAEYLYHKYVCELENIFNDVCPQLKDLYRTKLTLEKCYNETHALIFRVCRPVIMATLRYSYLDLGVKHDAINELIYIAPTVAFNIVNSPNRDSDGELLGSQIRASVELVTDRNDTTAMIIKALFRK